jgi:Holliday junction resolvase
MTLTNRQRGDYFERQVRDTLAANGWLVIRSAGSLGIADLVALRKGHAPRLVSCKLGGRIDPAERTALLDAADAAGADALVAWKPKRGRVDLDGITRASALRVTVEALRIPAHVPAVAPVVDGLSPPGEQLPLPWS